MIDKSCQRITFIMLDWPKPSEMEKMLQIDVWAPCEEYAWAADQRACQMRCLDRHGCVGTRMEWGNCHLCMSAPGNTGRNRPGIAIYIFLPIQKSKMTNVVLINS